MRRSPALRYPTRLRDAVRRIVREHMFHVPEPGDGVAARRFLARHGRETAFDLVAHKAADRRGKREDETSRAELERLAGFEATLERELSSPYRLEDLDVDGGDLIELGWKPSPALGEALQRLLAEVLVDPALNRREWLLAEAHRLREASP